MRVKIKKSFMRKKPLAKRNLKKNLKKVLKEKRKKVFMRGRIWKKTKKKKLDN